MINKKHFFKYPQQIDDTFSIRGIGIQELMPRVICDRPKGTGDWLIMYFCVPCMIMDQHAPAESLMIWPPGDYQKYGNLEQEWLHSWMHCDGSALPRWLKQAHLPVNTILSGLPEEHWTGTLVQILEELKHRDAYSDRIILNLVQNSLLQFGRYARPAANEETHVGVLHRVRRQIEIYYDQPISLAELVEQSGMSLSHFCAKFKETFGCSAIEYLIEQRMEQAAYLLYDRNLQVQEIARRVGYTDVFHFSKMFKKHHGKSPRDLRKQLFGS